MIKIGQDILFFFLETIKHGIYTYIFWFFKPSPPNVKRMAVVSHISCVYIYICIYISSTVFCPRAGPSPRLQFCPKTALPLQTQDPRLQFYYGWIGAAASRCFPHSTLSLASEQTLKDLKRSQEHQRGGEESGFGQLGYPDFVEIHISG